MKKSKTPAILKLLEIELNGKRECVYLSSYEDAIKMLRALQRFGAQVVLKVGAENEAYSTWQVIT